MKQVRIRTTAFNRHGLKKKESGGMIVNLSAIESK
jgi:hypothetical protein